MSNENLMKKIKLKSNRPDLMPFSVKNYCENGHEHYISWAEDEDGNDYRIVWEIISPHDKYGIKACNWIAPAAILNKSDDRLDVNNYEILLNNKKKKTTSLQESIINFKKLICHTYSYFYYVDFVFANESECPFSDADVVKSIENILSESEDETFLIYALKQFCHQYNVKPHQLIRLDEKYPLLDISKQAINNKKFIQLELLFQQ